MKWIGSDKMVSRNHFLNLELPKAIPTMPALFKLVIAAGVAVATAFSGVAEPLTEVSRTNKVSVVEPV